MLRGHVGCRGGVVRFAVGRGALMLRWLACAQSSKGLRNVWDQIWRGKIRLVWAHACVCVHDALGCVSGNGVGIAAIRVAAYTTHLNVHMVHSVAVVGPTRDFGVRARHRAQSVSRRVPSCCIHPMVPYWMALVRAHTAMDHWAIYHTRHMGSRDFALSRQAAHNNNLHTRLRTRRAHIHHNDRHGWAALRRTYT